ncbi:hypothetical protein FIBSPDRAFT_939043 [Athelia psychrophila]|uniref:UBX domain-containing protein n=1 Tax=Athelia psychrophila TaxID=1759441 RepID=A0A165XA73_9AGAM|nr:hypothetical protein FIBSPDRAFT_939043 [Fibularhizoctonia sp. CBS 109695]
MPSDKDTLLGMGFDPARVEWATKATGGRGLQPAMDHILENEGNPVPDLSAVSSSSAPNPRAMDDDDDDDDEDAEALRSIAGKGPGGTSAADLEARSIKCQECGKVFRNTAMANFHAEKSGHDQFEESTEEIKPLTEEEKAERLKELREKMVEKRAKKAAEDLKEHKVNENLRRKTGKEQNQFKEDLKVKEAMKEAAQKKKDKVDDARAKAAIKAQIELDKKARTDKFAREKAIRDGQPIAGEGVQASSSATPAAAGKPTAGVAGKDYKETRLQIRMATGGQPYTTTLPSESTLREVAEFLAGQTINVDVETVSFTQTFPRKQFTSADFSKTLKELGLTPSASDICQYELRNYGY